MFTKKIATVLSLMVVAWAMPATALSIPKDEGRIHELLEMVQVENGTISIYGFPGEEEPTEAAMGGPPTCGSNSVICDYKHHMADVSTCDSLITALRNNPDRSVPASPRDICFGGDGRCCLSWNEPVGGLLWGHLLPAVEKMRSMCVNSNVDRISAKSYDTHLVRACLAQCLSNKPHGC